MAFYISPSRINLRDGFLDIGVQMGTSVADLSSIKKPAKMIGREFALIKSGCSVKNHNFRPESAMKRGKKQDTACYY